MQEMLSKFEAFLKMHKSNGIIFGRIYAIIFKLDYLEG